MLGLPNQLGAVHSLQSPPHTYTSLYTPHHGPYPPSHSHLSSSTQPGVCTPICRPVLLAPPRSCSHPPNCSCVSRCRGANSHRTPDPRPAHRFFYSVSHRPLHRDACCRPSSSPTAQPLSCTRVASKQRNQLSSTTGACRRPRRRPSRPAFPPPQVTTTWPWHPSTRQPPKPSPASLLRYHLRRRRRPHPRSSRFLHTRLDARPSCLPPPPVCGLQHTRLALAGRHYDHSR